MALSDSPVAQQWIEQFDPEDQGLACKLLDHLVVVSGDDFKNLIQQQILRRANEVNGAVGLYVEREGLPHRLFSESAAAPKRASGRGPTPFASDANIGSEGIIAQIISELCRSEPERFLNHPGPDEIRTKPIGAFLLVTDFIGSGDRAYEYLESAWQVRSVRSWWSFRLLSFGVIAYSATAMGARKVRRHASYPNLSLFRTCPTIDSEFSKHESRLVRLLCEKYDPVLTSFLPSLGWGNVGALITFSHGIPDNAPNILWQGGGSRKRWFHCFRAGLR